MTSAANPRTYKLSYEVVNFGNIVPEKLTEIGSRFSLEGEFPTYYIHLYSYYIYIGQKWFGAVRVKDQKRINPTHEFLASMTSMPLLGAWQKVTLSSLSCMQQKLEGFLGRVWRLLFGGLDL